MFCYISFDYFQAFAKLNRSFVHWLGFYSVLAEKEIKDSFSEFMHFLHELVVVDDIPHKVFQLNPSVVNL